MAWLKDTIVDIVATTVIVITILTSNSFLSGVVWGYTALLLLVKSFVIIGDDFLNLMDKANTEAPEWFSHLLYAINSGILLFFHWWYAGAGWVLIWGLSYLTQQKLKQKSA